MPTITLNKTLVSNNRADIRREVTNWFLSESAGTGNGNLTSRAIYVVESYFQYGVELHRPGVFNKGFDFTVNVSGFYFKKNRCYSNPSHGDIINALSISRQNNQMVYDTRIKPILNSIFNCQVVNMPQQSMGYFNDYLGIQRPIEIILLCVKWLFIEQDITYWNWSGRQMFYNELRNRNLI